MKQLVREVCDEKGASIVALETMPDRLVKAIKGRSSRVLRAEFPYLKSKLPTLWTNSYFVATTGGAPLAAVKKYVEQQKSR